MAVEFNEPTYGVPSAPSHKQGALTSLVMKLGLAKDEKQAQTALIVILVVVVVITRGVLVLGGGGGPSLPPEASIPPEQLITPE